MNQTATLPPETAFEEVDEAVQHLYDLVHRRWHPKSEVVASTPPKDVCDALEDLREITLELKGLWDYLGAKLGRAA
ncbi:MAG TPA: hypothetical protein DEA08_09145 [Planctomycetes bacterium]|nr:hypothetical protein [Planctomycetota bacterium]